MRLNWSLKSRRDVTNLVSYIGENNPAAAQQQAYFIAKAAMGLMQFPEMGPETGNRDIRKLVVGNTPYIIAYRVRGDEVQILRVLHAKQRWPEI